MSDQGEKQRNYCLFLAGEKYNRNGACRLHDNLYGINGGGGRADRLAADRRLYTHMKDNRDPMALPTFLGIRLFGWFFFNYHAGQAPWTGQLIKKIWPGYNAPKYKSDQ